MLPICHTTTASNLLSFPQISKHSMNYLNLTVEIFFLKIILRKIIILESSENENISEYRPQKC